uniref:Retrovirus-related Pol polyprotein from transposon TNT 1-94 n=1 Tax=Cajanus cajan TaxID=3821 RepID=A0A151SXU8_CAJCA|nr:hypothetical protein KK1_015070 [Cajanus cajan]
MNECKPIPTPINLSIRLSKDKLGKLKDQMIYKGIIGSLIYLTTRRLNIVYSVPLFACFQYDLGESHLKVIKCIFIYFVNTTNLSLFYEKNKYYRMVEYFDAKYAGDKVERKNTSGRYHFLGPCFISYVSKK